MRAFVRLQQGVLTSLLLSLFACTATAGTVSYFGNGGDLNPAYFDSTCPQNVYGGYVCVGVTTYTIPVTDNYIINPGDSVTVDLYGLQYPFASDLEVNLTLEDSLGHILVPPIDVFNQIGCGASCPQFGNPVGSGNAGNYSFDTSFAGDLWAAANNAGYGGSIPDGQYFTSDISGSPPDQLSYAFGGRSVNGIWVLTVTDYCPPFSDCQSQQNPPLYNPGITAWGLDITPAPEPSTIIPTALAGLLLWGMRRRAANSR